MFHSHASLWAFVRSGAYPRHDNHIHLDSDGGEPGFSAYSTQPYCVATTTPVIHYSMDRMEIIEKLGSVVRSKELFKPDDSDTEIKFFASGRSLMTGFYSNSQGQDVHSAVHGRTVAASCCWTSRLSAAARPRRRVATRGLDGANTRIQREKGIKDSGFSFTFDILKGGAKKVARQHRLNLGTGVSELVCVFCDLCI